MCEWPTQTMSASTFCDPPGPDLRVLQQVLVERVAGRGVDQQEPLAAERDPLGDRQLQEIAPLVGPRASHIEGRETWVR